jgi:Right handed beta helix region
MSEASRPVPSSGRKRRVVRWVLAGAVVAALVTAPALVAADRLGTPDQQGGLPAMLPPEEEPAPAGEGAPDPDPQPVPPPPSPTSQSAGGSSWAQRGSPHRMVTVRTTSLDVVTEGRVTRHLQRYGSTITLAELDRYLPASWLTISDGTATLSATVVLTRGVRLDVRGDVKRLQLAGGASPSDAASVYTGGGALTLAGVSVAAVDPTTGQAVPPTAAGRPSIVVSGGGRLVGTDTTLTDLGTAPVGDEDGRGAIVFNPGSTGSLTRTTLHGGGVELLRSVGVRLADVTVTGSQGDGLVLSGDRGTELSGIRAIGNAGNGVKITGQNSDRPITGITTSGNGEFGITITGQTGTRITGVATASDRSGGLNISRSIGLVVTDFTAADQRIGVFTHIYSSGVVLDRIRTSGGRWGLSIEKSTQDLRITDSTFEGAQVAGVAVGGHQVTLTGVQVRDSGTGVRIERGAVDTQLTNLTVSGGGDGVVAISGTTGLVVAGLVADYVESDAVRTASPNTRITGARITGGETGIDAEAATTITDTTISATAQGIRSRSPELVQATGVTIDALSVGVNAAAGSPFVLADSHVHAIQSLRGEVTSQGTNDLSLPPLNVISVIGIPLIVLAIVLEEIHSIRQRRRRGENRPQPPLLNMGAT